MVTGQAPIHDDGKVVKCAPISTSSALQAVVERYGTNQNTGSAEGSAYEDSQLFESIMLYVRHRAV